MKLLGFLSYFQTCTCFKLLKWSSVTLSLLARNDTRGGARCKNVGWCFIILFTNVWGSNLDMVTIFPPTCKVIKDVTINPKMWNIGRTQTVLGCVFEVGKSIKSNPLAYTFWQIFDIKLSLVNITPEIKFGYMPIT